MSRVIEKAHANAAVRPAARTSVLVHLELTAEQRQSLARQGSILVEHRGGRKRVFKIRFRCAGRVMVRYLTTDPKVAELARQELAEMQRAIRAARKLRRLVRTARRALRQVKAASAPCLRAMGLVYHGYAPRCPRTAQSASDAMVRDGVLRMVQ